MRNIGIVGFVVAALTVGSGALLFRSAGCAVVGRLNAYLPLPVLAARRFDRARGCACT
jgi:hypothetical protein